MYHLHAPECTSHASQMHSGHVPQAFWMLLMSKGVAVILVLLVLYRDVLVLAQTRLMCVLDAYRMVSEFKYCV